MWTEGIDAQGRVKPSPGARRLPAAENHGVAGQQHHPSLVLHGGPPQKVSAASGAVRDRPATGRGKAVQGTDAAMPALPLGNNQQLITAHGMYLPAQQLTDPLFQDLDRTSRSYLAYCTVLL